MESTAKIHEVFNVGDEEILHIEDIAQMTKMHLESVRRWCRTGKLPAYNFGNKYIVVGSDFKDFMQRSKTKSRWVQMLDE